MRRFLRDLVARQSGWVELRHHRRRHNRLVVQKGRVDVASSKLTAGIGVRVLVDGSWGFASTVELDRPAIEQAIARARACAHEIATIQRKKIPPLPAIELASGEYVLDGFADLEGRSLGEKLEAVMELEARTRRSAASVHTAASSYTEMFEEKTVVTSDGACATQKLVRPELRVTAFAADHGEHAIGRHSLGVTGGWQCLFDHHGAADIADRAARDAVDLLTAPHVAGGEHTVILAPSVVGLLCHEAVGHTVEADFVLSGSVAAGKLGQRVASEHVTLRDSGRSELALGASGTLPFDDEGVTTTDTVIIDQGILVSYLHNRESAARFGVAPTGNARAWLYSDEPLIRMRNTYLVPGTQGLEEIIASTPHGYLIEGAGSGQADATGEFMFGCSHAVEIEGGKRGRKMKEVTISGIAFDVLATVDAVSSEFRWDLGAGLCGKGQPAKVDAGGPYVRCRVTLGGRQ